MNAEQAHHVTFKAIKIGFKIPGVQTLVNGLFGSPKGKEKTVMGLKFKNPIGPVSYTHLTLPTTPYV